MQEIHDDTDVEVTATDHAGLVSTRAIGTMWFVGAVVIVTIVWILLNTLILPKAFDPPPNFQLYLLISNFIQLPLMGLLLAGSNAQSKYAEKQTEVDHKNITGLIEHINAIDEKVDAAIAKRIQILDKKIDTLIQSMR